MKIAAQLYTIRDFMQTPADMEASFKKLHHIGYEAVQLSAGCLLYTSSALLPSTATP